MKDDRFPRPYILKTKDGEVEKLKKICEEYHIKDNGIFEYAVSFHISWAITDDGLMYISPTTFLNYPIDFKSLDELVDYLDSFEACSC